MSSGERRRRWASGSAFPSQCCRAALAAPRLRSRAISSAGADPIALAILRWGIGFLCVLPAALLLKVRWPERRDLPWVMLLGFCFFGLFFVLYNIAMSYTTAARASLALATLPLSTMVVGALLGYETLTCAQDDRRLHRGVRRGGRARRGPFGRARRRLARRSDHAGGRGLHGLLQRAVAAVHAALQRARLPHRRHGHRCCGAGDRRSFHREHRGAEKLRHARNGSPASISASAAARPPSSSGCWRCSGRRRPASPTP